MGTLFTNSNTERLFDPVPQGAQPFPLLSFRGFRGNQGLPFGTERVAFGEGAGVAAGAVPGQVELGPQGPTAVRLASGDTVDFSYQSEGADTLELAGLLYTSAARDAATLARVAPPPGGFSPLPPPPSGPGGPIDPPPSPPPNPELPVDVELLSCPAGDPPFFGDALGVAFVAYGPGPLPSTVSGFPPDVNGPQVASVVIPATPAPALPAADQCPVFVDSLQGACSGVDAATLARARAACGALSDADAEAACDTALDATQSVCAVVEAATTDPADFCARVVEAVDVAPAGEFSYGARGLVINTETLADAPPQTHTRDGSAPAPLVLDRTGAPDGRLRLLPSPSEPVPVAGDPYAVTAFVSCLAAAEAVEFTLERNGVDVFAETCTLDPVLTDCEVVFPAAAPGDSDVVRAQTVPNPDAFDAQPESAALAIDF